MELLRGLNTKEASLNEDQLRELISGQLRFKDISFEDAVKNPNWRSKYSISQTEHTEWINWAVDYLVNNHHMEEKEAQIQVSWMELKWGVKVDMNGN